MAERRGGFQLKKLHGQLGDVLYKFTQLNFSQFCPPEGWRPAINAYRLSDGLKICVDLAGVDKSKIDLQFEPGRLRLKGNRQPPEPPRDAEGKPVQIVMMEIDCGTFEREIAVPERIDGERVSAEQRNGLLWIDLPFKGQA